MRPSLQFRRKVRDALLRSIHHTSLYPRLIIANKDMGVCIHRVDWAIHKQLTSNSKEDITFLNFICGKLYNGKLAQIYGHAPAEECPLCHKHTFCRGMP